MYLMYLVKTRRPQLLELGRSSPIHRDSFLEGVCRNLQMVGR